MPISIAMVKPKRIAINSACKMSEDEGMKPENPDRKKPTLLQNKPPKPARVGEPIQLPSTFRIVQSKLLLFHLTCDRIEPQVHGLTKIVIKEYRSDKELFNSINFS